MAPRCVAKRKVPLEVDAPHVVGLLSVCQRTAAGRHSQPKAAGPNQTVAVQNVSDGAWRRNRQLRLLLAQHRVQLLRSVIGKLLSQIHDAVLDGCGRPMRAGTGHRLAVVQSLRTELSITLQPLVTLCSADAETATQSGKVAARVFLHGGDESNALI